MLMTDSTVVGDSVVAGGSMTDSTVVGVVEEVEGFFIEWGKHGTPALIYYDTSIGGMLPQEIFFNVFHFAETASGGFCDHIYLL